MKQSKKSKLVYRILSGTVSLLQDYYFIYPDIKILYDAQVLYDDVIDEFRFGGLITKEQAKHILITKGLLLPNIDKDIEEIQKNIENHKVDLYKARLNQANQKRIRKYLELTKDKLEENFAKKCALDLYTLEGYAESVKNNFIYRNCFVDSNYNKLDTTNKLFGQLVACLNQSYISDSEYRELARTEPWRNYWNAYKSPQVFDLFNERGQDKEKPAISFCNFNVEQQNLVSYTKMYDNIYESPDCPETYVLEDDDVLDGWLISQRREREEDNKKDSLESTVMSKHKNAQEIFVPASSKEDIKRIEDLNSTQSKIIKKQRASMIKDKGEVKDSEFIDIRHGKQQQQHKNYVDFIKGRRNG